MENPTNGATENKTLTTEDVDQSFQDHQETLGKDTGEKSSETVEEPQETDNFMELYEESLRSIQEGEVVKGEIVQIDKEYVLVDMGDRCIRRQSEDRWERIDNPLLELVCLVYLLNAEPEPINQEMVSVKELKSAHFFTGPHALRVEPLLDRYGKDLDSFMEAAESVGGEALDLADVAYKFLAFPKVPLYYLLWKGDEEFEPRLSILFDRSIEHHLAADAIWGLVNLVSDVLLSFPRTSTSERGQ